MKAFLNWCVGVFFALFHVSGMAQVGLYSTGPASDAAFVRFLNASTADLLITADGGDSLIVTSEAVVSPYLSIDASRPIKGTLSFLDTKYPLDLQLKPSEFVTVLVQNDESVQIVREEVDDFNALKASVSFYNADPQCFSGRINVLNKEMVVFEAIQPKELVRKEVNPIPLSLHLFCNDELVTETIDMGRLQPGERYSIFALPENQTKRFFYVLDEVSF